MQMMHFSRFKLRLIAIKKLSLQKPHVGHLLSSVSCEHQGDAFGPWAPLQEHINVKILDPVSGRCQLKGDPHHAVEPQIEIVNRELLGRHRSTPNIDTKR
jgi:hypothetical protein